MSPLLDPGWVFSLTLLTNRVDRDVTWVSAAVMMPFFPIFFFCHAQSQATVLWGDWEHYDWALNERWHWIFSHDSKFTWMGFSVPSRVAQSVIHRSRPFMWVLYKLYSHEKNVWLVWFQASVLGRRVMWQEKTRRTLDDISMLWRNWVESSHSFFNNHCLKSLVGPSLTSHSYLHTWILIWLFLPF